MEAMELVEVIPDTDDDDDDDDNDDANVSGQTHRTTVVVAMGEALISGEEGRSKKSLVEDTVATRAVKSVKGMKPGTKTKECVVSMAEGPQVSMEGKYFLFFFF